MAEALQKSPLQSVIQKRPVVSAQSLVAFVPVVLSLVLTPLPLLLRLLLIFMLVATIGVLLYSHSRSQLRRLERSIEPVPIEDTCAQHTSLSELFVATNSKYQHDLIDRNAPAVIQVEDVSA